jgi:hypothetical protein
MTQQGKIIVICAKNDTLNNLHANTIVKVEEREFKQIQIYR